MWWCSWRGSYRNGGTLPSWPWYERSTLRGRSAAPAQLRAKGTGNGVRLAENIKIFKGLRDFLFFFSCSFFRFLRALHEGDPTDCTTTKGQKTGSRIGGNIKILKDLRGFLLVIVVLIRISREWGLIVCTNTKGQQNRVRLAENKILNGLRDFSFCYTGFKKGFNGVRSCSLHQTKGTENEVRLAANTKILKYLRDFSLVLFLFLWFS